jgi:hypothetical protein
MTSWQVATESLKKKNNHWLVVYLPLWKILISQMGRIIPYMNWKIKNVWNHQPDQICGVGKAANHPQISQV